MVSFLGFNRPIAHRSHILTIKRCTSHMEILETPLSWTNRAATGGSRAPFLVPCTPHLHAPDHDLSRRTNHLPRRRQGTRISDARARVCAGGAEMVWVESARPVTLKYSFMGETTPHRTTTRKIEKCQRAG